MFLFFLDNSNSENEVVKNEELTYGGSNASIAGSTSLAAILILAVLAQWFR